MVARPIPHPVPPPASPIRPGSLLRRPAAWTTLLLALCLVTPLFRSHAAPAPAADPAAAPASATTDPRPQLVRAIVSTDAAEQVNLLRELATLADPRIKTVLTAWRGGSLYLHETADGTSIPFLLDASSDTEGRSRGIAILDERAIPGEDGSPMMFLASDLTPADTSSKLRKAIKTALDFLTLAHPNPKLRRDAIVKLGQERNIDYEPLLKARTQLESDPEVTRALAEAIALTQTASSDPAVRIPAIRQLGELRSINSLTYLQSLEKELKDKTPPPGDETLAAVHKTVIAIEDYVRRGNLVGTAFRGFSLAAVLLVAALGLAITFGLMGIINMAHGELMMVGAYTTYVVQNLFVHWFGASGFGFESYFLFALAASFVTAGIVGLILERGVIRFLYRRPLESLLATWGVSLLLQQVFRHVFGAANVQVGSPGWLSGSLVIQDVLFAYNRIFVIAFGFFIVAGTWALLTQTSLGLQIRAVMQNRAMASTLGVRTTRINMLTFAYGSGLAGMAGACLSQIGNVGPSLGQNYIVDCFMIVVLGGVGNVFGTVAASFGVGVTDQILQPWLGAVMGKITVLAAIILFLQWRPAGLFVTRSRNLEG